MKNFFVFGLCLCLAVGLAGCGKSDPDPVAEATPSPTPKAVDNKDFSARNIRHKADQAANSFEKFLRDQDPKLRTKVERLANKVSDKLGPDKDHWREKLEQERRKIQPQIEQLRQKLGEADGDKNKDRIRDALSKLESKNADTDKKLAELEAAGADVWPRVGAIGRGEDGGGDRCQPDNAAPQGARGS